jgi:glycosyltransferase involved in cell wall biosynthesis
VGRVVPEKNLAFLLRAFARVRLKVPAAWLLVVGGGPHERSLHNLAQDLGIAGCTVFTGRAPYAQVPDLLALADLFVTASVVEVQPLSIIEGLAAGLSALAIASDAVTDTLTDGYDSLLADGSCHDYAARWVALLSDDALRARLSANARESSRRYDVRCTAGQMVELYAQVIDEGCWQRCKTRPAVHLDAGDGPAIRRGGRA